MLDGGWTALYRLLLRLYPAGFRRLLGEEMVTVFGETLAEARQQGPGAVARVVMRELLDFPGSLLRAYKSNWQGLGPRPLSVPHPGWMVAWALLGLTVIPLGWLLSPLAAVLFLPVLSLVLPGPAAAGWAQAAGFVLALALWSASGQWWLLRRHLPGAQWWVPLSLAGWLLSALLVAALAQFTNAWLRYPLLMLVVLGAGVSLAQWLLLRRVLPGAGGWVPLNVAAFSLVLLAGRSFGSLQEMVTLLALPHVIAGTVLWLLIWRAASVGPARVPALPKAANVAPGGRRLQRLLMPALLLLPLFVAVAPWAYSVGWLELAKREGVYPSAEAAVRAMAAQVEDAEVVSLDVQAGPTMRDGSLPHVWFGGGAVVYDRVPRGWNRASASMGSYYVRVEEGWVHLPEGSFPVTIGRLMAIYGLEGAGR